jgi:hypothetical protein
MAAAVVRFARDRTWWPLLPAGLSWLLLFGYQWAFYLAYRGGQHTVFSYASGVLGDGLFIPALNVACVAVLRSLKPYIAWRRLPLYALLGFATAMAAFLAQAGLDLTNWSMPVSFRWSPVGQFHFFVMWSEMAFLYLVLATAVNNWSRLREDTNCWRAFLCGWLGVALFATTLAVDYVR